jgi:hypothetical protein
MYFAVWELVAYLLISAAVGVGCAMGYLMES